MKGSNTLHIHFVQPGTDPKCEHNKILCWYLTVIVNQVKQQE